MNKKQYIILGTIVFLLLIIFFLPEYKKEGQSKQLFSFPLNKIKKIEYQGTIHLDNQNNAFIHYTIHPQKTSYKQSDKNNKNLFLWKVDILDFQYTGKNKNFSYLKNIKSFYANQMIKSLFNDLRKLTYIYSTPADVKKEEEYGYKNCKDNFTIHEIDEKYNFCIGTTNYSKSKNYVYSKHHKKVYLIHHYILRRLQKNIFDYREEKILPFSLKNIETAEFIFNKKYQKRYPLLYKKTMGHLKFTSEIYQSKRKNARPRTIYKMPQFKFVRTFLIETLFKRLEALKLKGYNTKDTKLNQGSSLIVKIKLKGHNKVFHVNIWDQPILSKWNVYYKTDKKINNYKDSFLMSSFASSSNSFQQQGIYDSKAYENILKKLDDLETQLKEKLNRDKKKKKRKK